MKIYGNAGSATEGTPYTFNDNQWRIYNPGNNSNVVWRFSTITEGTADPTLANANIRLRTINFETDDWSVQATKTMVASVVTDSAVSNTVSFYVWSANTNVAQIVNTASPAYMAAGSTESLFYIRGVAEGTTQIYLSSEATLTEGLTNYVTKTVTVSAAPAPTVSVSLPGMDIGNSLTVMESDSTVNYLTVKLSHAYTTADLWVRLDLDVTGNIRFDASPKYVKITKGNTESAAVPYWAIDGTTASYQSGVVITPSPTNDVAGYYQNLESATVKVLNVVPSLTTPTTNDVFQANRQIALPIEWAATDVVQADTTNNLTITWQFGDGTIATVTTGAQGVVTHTYSSTGTKSVKATVKDKDGGSTSTTFNVVVTEAAPRPTVRVETTFDTYGETSDKNSGQLRFVLSEPYTAGNVYVRLAVEQAESNLTFGTLGPVLISNSGTNSSYIKFNIADGTDISSATGIGLTPVITNNDAAAYFTTEQRWVWVTNVAPVVTRLMDIRVDALTNVVAASATLSKTFSFEVSDADADLNPVTTRWLFGDGTGEFIATGVSNRTGYAQGSISHTYQNQGIYTVEMQAEDKGGGVSKPVSFTVRVGPAPSVYVLTPAGVLAEDSVDENTITVQLTSGFTNAVTVDLAVTPANSSANGWMDLWRKSVTFPAISADQIGTVLEQTVAISNILEGTEISRYNGFTITPTVSATALSKAFYTNNLVAGTVKIQNVRPEIVNPSATDITSTTVAYTITQGENWTFFWDIDDVLKDRASMTVTWNFGDGETRTVTGASGSLLKSYSASGDMTVTVRAVDKDGGSDKVQFKVRIAPGKTVIVTPVGPNETVSYYGATGLGNGIVVDETAKWYNYNDIYYFKYGPSVDSATLRAVPYKTGVANYYNVVHYSSTGAAITNAVKTYFDSFFFVWVGGTEQGLTEADVNPSTAGSSAVVTLPTSVTSTDGTTSSVADRNIQAIFSREWREADNVGDINQDGIPDATAAWILSQTSETSDTATDTGTTPNYLKPLNAFNGDLDGDGNSAGDFLPVNPTGVLGLYDFRAVADPDTAEGAVPVNAFTALKEVRGYHLGLNKQGISDVDGIQDEPGTNPALVDTDSDGYPDGWEYWFWYQAQFASPRLTGEAYNPANVGQGTFITAASIILEFDPVAARGTVSDFDKDGLTDAEELVLGTNPTHWDTDHDGMCDAWEVLRSLDPCDPGDASLNDDGDYMAYATVNRQLVTVVTDGVNTNSYLAVGAAEGTNTGSFTTWYYYGATNRQIMAVGRPVAALSANAIVVALVQKQAVLVHAQVMREFGFDPRTAWTDTVNYHSSFDRFPTWLATPAATNTVPFTALDEYLVMQYIAENRLNGSDGTMAASELVWSENTTHPLTPDSDVTEKKQDGMPDGWELYVSLNPSADLNTVAGRTMRISPWNELDGDLDHPVTDQADKLKNLREFAGTDSSAAYTNVTLYATTNFPGVVSIKRPADDENWINKYWPTNPWSPDTDGDGAKDADEKTFVYGVPTDNHGTCAQGGGLNPNAIDTDLDGLPDKWEMDFMGTVPAVGTAIANTPAITNGMDGTYSDYSLDWDKDGLENYQEYWVQAVRHFRYDIPLPGELGPVTGNAGLPMDGTSQPSSLFTQVTNSWDLSKYPWGDKNPNLWVLLPVGPAKQYVSTDPRDFDTDTDGMDDYYEMFHGLNPILGEGILATGMDDRVARAYVKDGAFTIDYGSAALGNDWGRGLYMDFVNYPWLAGMLDADPDADGLLNLEEMLQPDAAAPSPSNTDPTPLWMTDDSSTNIVAPLVSYYWYGQMYFWPGTKMNLLPLNYRMFAYEKNEGFDTDNDGVSDKAELMVTTTAQSDPQDHDDPVRRQALWFDGERSAAQTMSQTAFNEWSFRAFTVELWACPEVVSGKEQVLIERPMVYSSGDLSTTGDLVRVNFRIGISADGRVYGMYQNAGVHDEQTGQVIAYGPVLTANKWVHIAIRMDGSAGKFELYVNDSATTTFGPCNTVDTLLVPANGVIAVVKDPTMTQYPTPNYIITSPGVLVLGAANICPMAYQFQFSNWANYTNFYQGYIDEVRVWDGARTDTEIEANFKKRLIKSDVMANRTSVRQSEAYGGSRGPGVSLQLPAELVHHYSFDNLFGSDRATTVATAPRGFNHYAVAINRPAGYTVGWWSSVGTHSDVYTDYGYVPWIENSVEHLPFFGGVQIEAGTSNLVVRETDTVLDSVYWATYSSGGVSAETHNLSQYTFPNSNNPYGFYYSPELAADMTQPDLEGTWHSSDMLPLGNAYAKQASVMWDADAPSAVWAETGDDTDADGLPDWWEELRGFDPESASGADGWYGDADGDGVINGEDYLRDIAMGWRLGDTIASGPTGVVQTADVDGDGLPDWWEALYNLAVETGLDNASVVVSENGTLGDPDKDGLSNFAEYQISEHYRFSRLSPVKFKSGKDQKVSDYFLKEGKLYYGEMFSDHDFMEDTWEDLYDIDAVNRFAYDSHLDSDEDGWSNWSESRYGTSSKRSDPTLISHLSPLSTTLKDFPVPQIEATLSYGGLQKIGNLQIEVFSDAAMNGIPDAIFTQTAADGASEAKTRQLGYWGEYTVKGALAPGSIVPGTVVFRFSDTTPSPTTDWSHTYWSLAKRSVDASVDVGGVIKAREASGLTVDIGTINYLTGEFEIDLSLMAGWTLRYTEFEFDFDDEGVLMILPKLDVNDAYVVINYSVMQVATWPKTLYLAEANAPTDAQPCLGYVKEGKNYFFAFIDLDASGTWDAGEPCGVAEGCGVDIGYDRNQVKIGLTDYTSGYLRMSLSPAKRSEDVYLGTSGSTGSGSSSGTAASGLQTHVRVVRKKVGSTAYSYVVLDKQLQTRTYLHEGDVLVNGALSLDWGLAGVASPTPATNIIYDVVLGDDPVLSNNVVLSFTNYFGARAIAVGTFPINGSYVYSSRPTFKWTMPEGYTAFAIEIKSLSSGRTVYSSGAIQAPGRNNNGECVWTAPIYANTRLPSGEIFQSNAAYSWQVIALNAKFSTTTSGWSEQKKFRLDVNSPIESSGYGAIKARVKYFGPVSSGYLTNCVRVQAFCNAGFAGVPEAEYTLTGTDLATLTSGGEPVVNAVLKGLEPSLTAGSYYLRAFIDGNTNGVRDVWESWGYANYYGSSMKPYDPRAVDVVYSVESETVDIMIEDADTDRDWFPDAYEYFALPGGDFLNNMGPATCSDGDSEVTAALSATGAYAGTSAMFTTLSVGTTDQDGDGLGDLAELLLGSDAALTSSAGDGYSDGDKVALGLSPVDTLHLNLTGLSTDAALQPAVRWTVEVQKASTTDRSVLSLVSGTVAADTVPYKVMYTPSLTNPQWVCVKSGVVALDGVQALTSKIEGSVNQLDPARGFFRVTLGD